MTIYELEKQATPGPLERHPCNIEPRNALTVRSADNRCYTVALVYDKKDAVRLQHCANNFLRLLEFTKSHGPCNGCSGQKDLMCGSKKCLITELEEVK